MPATIATATIATAATRSYVVFLRVHLRVCVSAMIRTLAHAARMDTGRPGSQEYTVVELGQQAQDLCAPVLDYEKAAREAGWTDCKGVGFRHRDGRISAGHAAGDWERLCAQYDIDPHEREVYEHWAVSHWLAEKLIAAGERVDTDFAGLNVWARTAPGDVNSDPVLLRIAAAA